MLANLSQLFRYRGLIYSLVARELKARYRGSVLGFFWSFVNPLLLLAIYSFIFSTIMPNRAEGLQPYALFLLCGILPWNWFSTSLNEAAGSLIAGGNLIKKVLFPAEVLPIVTVLAQTAERAEDIDVARAQRARQRAEERLAKPADAIDRERAQASVLRATVMLSGPPASLAASTSARQVSESV